MATRDEYLRAAVKELQYLRNEAALLGDDGLAVLVFLIDQALVEARGKALGDRPGAPVAAVPAPRKPGQDLN
jgi:hypothetical protein